ncbi:hypothetical protein SBV1_1560001 [Verrucomicrobia bacterium]|nr:hypothetical protein SBV1_1560001 [Verrucomicrobiota bacterium]
MKDEIFNSVSGRRNPLPEIVGCQVLKMRDVKSVDALCAAFTGGCKEERVINAPAHDTVCHPSSEISCIILRRERYDGEILHKILFDQLPRNTGWNLGPSRKASEHGVSLGESVSGNKPIVSPRFYSLENRTGRLVVRMIGKERGDNDVGVAENLHRCPFTPRVSSSSLSWRDSAARSRPASSVPGPEKTSTPFMRLSSPLACVGRSSMASPRTSIARVSPPRSRNRSRSRFGSTTRPAWSI